MVLLVIYPLDISLSNNTISTFNQIEKKLGNIGTVILNAGINEPMHSQNFSSKTFEKIMHVNYIGTVNSLPPAKSENFSAYGSLNKLSCSVFCCC